MDQQSSYYDILQTNSLPFFYSIVMNPRVRLRALGLPEKAVGLAALVVAALVLVAAAAAA